MTTSLLIELLLPLLFAILIFWSGMEFGFWLARTKTPDDPEGPGGRPPCGRRGTTNNQHSTPNIQRGGENVSGDRKLALTQCPHPQPLSQPLGEGGVGLSPEEREKAAQQHRPTRVLADGHIGSDLK